jgi:hypothetical protein
MRRMTWRGGALFPLPYHPPQCLSDLGDPASATQRAAGDVSGARLKHHPPGAGGTCAVVVDRGRADIGVPGGGGALQPLVRALHSSTSQLNLSHF